MPTVNATTIIITMIMAKIIVTTTTVTIVTVVEELRDDALSVMVPNNCFVGNQMRGSIDNIIT